MSILSIDFETRSTVNLPKAGVYVYAEHPTTDIWCMAWAFDDEEPQIWTPPTEYERNLAYAAAVDLRFGNAEFTDVGGGYVNVQPVDSTHVWTTSGLPQRILDHIFEGGEVRAWNAQFERIIWREIMVKRYGAPSIKLEQFVCSAAEAAAMALPRHLGGAAHILGVEQQKDDKGYQLMLRMARPRKINDDGTIVWWDVREKLDVLFSYCKQDVRTERSLVRALRRLTPREREVYLLDQRINDRGIGIDTDLVAAAHTIVDIGVTRANARLDDLTNGDVSAITNNKRLLRWLNENDVDTDSISKKAIAALQENSDDLADDVEEVLTLRASAGRSSVAKLKAFDLVTCADHRARGLLLYHGASTGRWTGKLIQPHNFPRGEVKNVESFIPWVMEGEYDAIDLCYSPIVVVLSMLRAMLIAEESHELISADFSAIEARVLNWLAGQEDVLDLFRAMDAGDKSKHPYKVMAWKMGRAPSPELVKKPSDDYQAGKAAELGCGFGMGADKFVRAAWDVYQLRVDKKEAKNAVDTYRATHPMVKQLWYDAENACMGAVLNPGKVFTFGARNNLKAVKRGAYLYIVLPSGRPLCYAAPSIKDRETPWGEMKASLHYWTVDGKTHQWVEEAAYGGLIVENIVQAASRDLLADAMLRAEARDYLPVLSVHDEIVCEVELGHGSVREFEELMSELPAWAEGCPVAAEGWASKRYRK